MSSVREQFASSVSIASLLGIGFLLAPIAALAITPTTNSVLLSQAPRWRQTYVCGNFPITLSEQGRDRYTYEATNARGQTLTIRNGTHHAGRNYSSIYSFNKDNSTYVLEDFGGGKAALSIGSYPNSSMTYNCTTDGNP